jgi:hypothetical protein
MRKSQQGASYIAILFGVIYLQLQLKQHCNLASLLG